MQYIPFGCDYKEPLQAAPLWQRLGFICILNESYSAAHLSMQVHDAVVMNKPNVPCERTAHGMHVPQKQLTTKPMQRDICLRHGYTFKLVQLIGNFALLSHNAPAVNGHLLFMYNVKAQPLIERAHCISSLSEVPCYSMWCVTLCATATPIGGSTGPHEGIGVRTFIWARPFPYQSLSRCCPVFTAKALSWGCRPAPQFCS